jgi:hypothetical protein
MKIRIRGNSIRYRLDKMDIAYLQEQQEIEETTIIGPGSLHFFIKATAGAPAISIAASVITLSLPPAQVAEWTTTDQVGFSLELPNPDGSVIKILVEKDFKCLTEREEDDSQAFENPAQSC